MSLQTAAERSPTVRTIAQPCKRVGAVAHPHPSGPLSQQSRPGPVAVHLRADSKHCGRCVKTLPLIQFRTLTTGTLHSYCRPCEREYNRERELSRAKRSHKPKGIRDSAWQRQQEADRLAAESNAYAATTWAQWGGPVTRGEPLRCRP